MLQWFSRLLRMSLSVIQNSETKSHFARKSTHASTHFPLWFQTMVLSKTRQTFGFELVLQLEWQKKGIVWPLSLPKVCNGGKTCERSACRLILWRLWRRQEFYLPTCPQKPLKEREGRESQKNSTWTLLNFLVSPIAFFRKSLCSVISLQFHLEDILIRLQFDDKIALRLMSWTLFFAICMCKTTAFRMIPKFECANQHFWHAQRKGQRFQRPWILPYQHDIMKASSQRTSRLLAFFPILPLLRISEKPPIIYPCLLVQNCQAKSSTKDFHETSLQLTLSQVSARPLRESFVLMLLSQFCALLSSWLSSLCVLVAAPMKCVS